MFQISEQVKILLERMDLYPDEFVLPFDLRHQETKWSDVLNEGRFTWMEKILIKRKYMKLKRRVTQDAIMATIIRDKDVEINEVSFDTISRAAKKLESEAVYKRVRKV